MVALGIAIVYSRDRIVNFSPPIGQVPAVLALCSIRRFGWNTTSHRTGPDSARSCRP